MKINDRVRSKYNVGTVVAIQKNGDPIIRWDGFAYDIPVDKDVASELVQVVS